MNRLQNEQPEGKIEKKHMAIGKRSLGPNFYLILLLRPTEHTSVHGPVIRLSQTRGSQCVVPAASASPEPCKC